MNPRTKPGPVWRDGDPAAHWRPTGRGGPPASGPPASGPPQVVVDARGLDKAVARTVVEELRKAPEVVEELRTPPSGVKTLRGLVKALREDAGTSGGYLVPAETARDVLALAVAQVVRPRAQVLELSSGSLRVPTLDQGGAAGLAGMPLAWAAEGATLPDADPAFQEATLRAEKLGGVILLSAELLEDAAAEAVLRQLAARAVAHAVDRAGLLGSGVGEPLGALTAPCAIGVARANGNQVRAADLARMLGRLHPSCYSPATAVYLVSPAALVDLAGSLDLAGRPLSWAGLPILPSEHLAALGSARDACLVDFGSYLLGDRGLEIELSRDVPAAWGADQVAVRVRWRGDGAPWLAEPVALAGDPATTGSCAVYLS